MQTRTRAYISSQILGYTGTVSNAELEELGEGYESNDIVGKSGIEKSMESELSGVKGECLFRYHGSSTDRDPDVPGSESRADRRCCALRH